jgi:hypothetical protein
MYGNRRLSKLKPDYMDYHYDNNIVNLVVDNKKQNFVFGSMIKVNDKFLIPQPENYRVNIIGYVNPQSKKETDVNINLDKMLKQYSIDKKGLIYRVEFYKKDKFAGMLLIQFS